MKWYTPWICFLAFVLGLWLGSKPEPMLTYQLPVTQLEMPYKCLTRAMLAEARNQGYQGMYLVGSTVMNRATRQGKRICQVTNARHYAELGELSRPADIEAYQVATELAQDMLSGAKPPKDRITHFVNKKKLTRKPRWLYSARHVTKYKQHDFYEVKKI